MKTRFYLFVAGLLLIKTTLGLIVVYYADGRDLLSDSKAIASEPQPLASAAAMPASGEGLKELRDIHQQQSELQLQMQRVEDRKAELAAIQADISEKIAELSRLREEIRQIHQNIQDAAEKKQADEAARAARSEEKLKHLIKAYGAMKPQNAAALIEKLDMELAIKLLTRMKGDEVGNILANIDAEKAALLSKGLVKIADVD